jgi:integrase
MKKPGVELSGWSKLMPRLNKASSVDFTLHDLRRTTRTLMSRLGVLEDHAEMAIGHVRKDLVARYNRDEAWGARVAAFEKVSDHIAGLLQGDRPTIKPLKRKVRP